MRRLITEQNANIDGDTSSGVGGAVHYILHHEETHKLELLVTHPLLDGNFYSHVLSAVPCALAYHYRKHFALEHGARTDLRFHNMPVLHHLARQQEIWGKRDQWRLATATKLLLDAGADAQATMAFDKHTGVYSSHIVSCMTSTIDEPSKSIHTHYRRQNATISRFLKFCWKQIMPYPLLRRAV